MAVHLDDPAEKFAAIADIGLDSKDGGAFISIAKPFDEHARTLTGTKFDNSRRVPVRTRAVHWHERRADRPHLRAPPAGFARADAHGARRLHYGRVARGHGHGMSAGNGARCGSASEEVAAGLP